MHAHLVYCLSRCERRVVGKSTPLARERALLGYLTVALGFPNPNSGLILECFLGSAPRLRSTEEEDRDVWMCFITLYEVLVHAFCGFSFVLTIARGAETRKNYVKCR